jgi:hypothetical protein
LKKYQIFLVFLLVFTSINAQTEDAWVYFKNKPSEATFLNSPLTMLTQRSLDRRVRYNIPLDTKDVPVEAAYVLQIKNASGISIKSRSKWLNALHVQGLQADIENLKDLEIVKEVVFANKFLNTAPKNNIPQKIIKQQNKLEIQTNFNYGAATNQISMLKGEVLHENNFTGEGMQIAVIDAGFPNVNSFEAFDRIINNNQILGGYDFVNRNSNFYTGYYHGMAVLSTIAGYVENDFVGTAPDADFYLFITEDNNNETPLEESLWVEAAEKADSLGVDVLNTSLGYTTFDNPNYNYTYSNMDGNTTFISKGSEIAFSRGMIVVNSAGNEGNNTWHYISAPADAASVLSIGAVNAAGVIASFSSYGPTFDGRVKPDVCAQGANVYIINSAGNIATSNGTSFSGPIIAGAVACLWQAFPNKSNAEIVQIIKESAHLYSSPTNHEGYGIPNFENAYNTLHINDITSETSEIILYPNPVFGDLFFKIPLTVDKVNVQILNLLGQQVYSSVVDKNNSKVDISFLNNTFYLVRIQYNNSTNTIKILKTENGK